MPLPTERVLAETDIYSAEEVVALLNDYFTRMIEPIFRYEGTLDLGFAQAKGKEDSVHIFGVVEPQE